MELASRRAHLDRRRALPVPGFGFEEEEAGEENYAEEEDPAADAHGPAWFFCPPRSNSRLVLQAA
jgi:hypothetical protein